MSSTRGRSALAPGCARAPNLCISIGLGCSRAPARVSGGIQEDIQAFVRRWRADGHLSAVMKDEGAARAQEVLSRKRAEHKASFLGLATEVG